MAYSVKTKTPEYTYTGFAIRQTTTGLVAMDVPRKGREYVAKAPYQIRDEDQGMTPVRDHQMVTVYYSQPVTDLYAEYHRDPELMKRNYRWNMELFEQLFKLDILFTLRGMVKGRGMDNITNIQTRFLQDVNNFRGMGQMDIPMYSWKRMLTFARTDGYSPSVRKERSGYLTSDEDTISDMADWIRMDGGVEHILDTLYLVYGRPVE